MSNLINKIYTKNAIERINYQKEKMKKKQNTQG